MNVSFLPKRARISVYVVAAIAALVGGGATGALRVVDLVKEEAAEVAETKVANRLGEIRERLVRIETLLTQRCDK